MANNFFKVNKGIGLVPQTSDPSPANNGDIYYNSTLGKFRKYENGSWSNMGSGSGSDSIITEDNSNFEASVGSWTTYADAAGTQPVDGTGGSPNVTFTRITSGVLNGSGSARLTKDAANRQGQGASLTLTVPNYIKGLPSKVQFSLSASSNFDFGTALDSSDPADVTVYLYDVTNSKLLQPYPYSIISNGIFEGMVQIPSDCSSLRLILHVTTTNANAWTLDIDDVSISAAVNETVNADSDWEYVGTSVIEATTTNPTKGTIATDEVYMRKNGPDLEVRISYRQTTAGTAGSGDYLFKMPYNYKIDTTKVKINNTVQGSGFGPVLDSNVGYMFGSFSNTVTMKGVVSPYSEDYVRVATVSSASGSNSSEIISSGVRGLSTAAALSYLIYFKVPVKGFTSGQITAASANLNAPVIFRATKNAGSVSAATDIPTWTTTNKDTVSGFNISTGVYTIKSPGDYYIEFRAQQTANTTGVASIVKNGTVLTTGEQALSSSTKNVSTLAVDLKVGDTISVQLSVAATLNASEAQNVFSIHKVETSGRVYSTRVAYIKDEKASGTNGGTATSGAYQTRTLNTLSGDTSFVSLSSNQFTLQPGTYKIKSTAPAQSAGGSEVQFHKIKLRNITDSTDTIIGSTAYNETVSGVGISTMSTLSGVFSISSAKTFEIQHRVAVTHATIGFGQAASFGDNEVYTQVEIEKVL